MANNIDLIGDRETLLQILKDDFSETNGHFEDELITTVRQSGFRGLTTLKSVYLPNATKLDTAGFYSCSNLRSARFPSLTDCNYNDLMNGSAFLDYVDLGTANGIKANVFNGCVWLKDLVLRTDSVVPLNNANSFNRTQIESVYVPRSLISSYQVASVWSTLYANNSNLFKALEDYTADGTVTGELNWNLIDAIPTPLYSITEQAFDGSNYVDTELQLFSTTSPEFTIICDFDYSSSMAAYAGIFGCFVDGTGGIKAGRHGGNATINAEYKRPGITTTQYDSASFSNLTNGDRLKLVCCVKSGLSTYMGWTNSVIGTTSYNSYAAPSTTMSKTLVVGKNDWGNNAYYSGTIHNFKVYNKALNGRQIRTVLGID